MFFLIILAIIVVGRYATCREFGLSALLLLFMSRDCIASVAGLMVYLVRVYYTTRFRYKPPIFQPNLYVSTRKMLTLISAITLLVTLSLIVLDHKLESALQLLALCIVLQIVSCMYTYLRAISGVVKILTIAPNQRREIATQMVVADIQEGRLV